MMTDSPKVAVFGGTGFIGSYLIKELSTNSVLTNVIVRKDSIHKLPNVKNNKIIKGDLSEVESIKATIKDCNIIIYAVGIIREYPKSGITFDKLHYEYFKNIVDLAKSNGVKRIIYISANGVRNDGTKYQSTKYRAEQYLINNFDNWTIFRPSVVFGNPEGRMEFVSQLKEDIIDKYIPVPLFFNINPFNYNIFFKSNPIHVNDLAKLIVKSIDHINSKNQVYHVGGPVQTTWSSMLKTISNLIGKRKLYLPVPISIVQIVATICGRFNLLPITSTQIKMLKEDNTCDSEKLFEEYNIQPTAFNSDSIKYLNN